MRILVIEDDVQLRTGLEELLEQEYTVITVGSVAEARAIRREAAQTEKNIDLFLLDIMLQDGLGFELCREIREQEDTPVIFLTALEDEEHTIQGLNMGGDDYIAKPFRSRELLARISAHIRRHQSRYSSEAGVEKLEGGATAGSVRGYIQSGDICFFTKEERVYCKGQEISLRRVELELLKYFLESRGRLLRREQILDYIWDSVGDIVEDNTLSVQISRLRKQIGRYQGEEYIETIRGIGYRWNQEIKYHKRNEEAGR